MARKWFLDIPEEFTRLEESQFVILPVAYDGTASYLKGTAEAPQAIIEASYQSEAFDEELLGGFYERGIATVAGIDGKGKSPEEIQALVYAEAKKHFQNGKKLFSLGGEHSISAALIKAAAEKHKKLSALHIDAHADLRDEYEGSKYNHACVMRRVAEMGVPFVSVGIRSFEDEQLKFIKSNNIPVFGPGCIEKDRDWVRKVVDHLTDEVYVTFDIDGLDPSVAPGTGTPEPGGMTYRQAVELIFATGRARRIIGGDMVEVIPGVCGVVTEFTAARLVYKMIVASQLRDIQEPRD
jgi:agmatinase